MKLLLLFLLLLFSFSHSALPTQVSPLPNITLYVGNTNNFLSPASYFSNFDSLSYSQYPSLPLPSYVTESAFRYITKTSISVSGGDVVTHEDHPDLIMHFYSDKYRIWNVSTRAFVAVGNEYTLPAGFGAWGFLDLTYPTFPALEYYATTADITAAIGTSITALYAVLKHSSEFMVLTTNAGFLTVNWTDLSAVDYTLTSATSLSWAHAVPLDPNKIVGSKSASLYFFDISDPLNIQALGSYTHSPSSYRYSRDFVIVDENYILSVYDYSETYTSYRFRVISTDWSTNPVTTSRVQDTGGGYSYCTQSKGAFYLYSSYNVRVYDLDMSSPSTYYTSRLKGTGSFYASGYAGSMTVNNGLAFVTKYNGENRLYMYDIYDNGAGFLLIGEGTPSPAEFTSYIDVEVTASNSEGDTSGTFRIDLHNLWLATSYPFTEDTPLTLTDDWITAPNSITATVTIKLKDFASGELSVSPSYNTATATYDEVSKTITATGSINMSDLNQLLKTVTYTPSPHYRFNAHLSVVFNDGFYTYSKVVDLINNNVPSLPEFSPSSLPDLDLEMRTSYFSNYFSYIKSYDGYPISYTLTPTSSLPDFITLPSPGMQQIGNYSCSIMYGVVTYQSIAYITCNTGLIIVRIDSFPIQVLNTVLYTPSPTTPSVALEYPFLYIGDQSTSVSIGGIYIYDISVPSDPVFVKFYHTTYKPARMTVNSRIIFSLDRSSSYDNRYSRYNMRDFDNIIFYTRSFSSSWSLDWIVSKYGHLYIVDDYYYATSLIYADDEETGAYSQFWYSDKIGWKQIEIVDDKMYLRRSSGGADLVTLDANGYPSGTPTQILSGTTYAFMKVVNDHIYTVDSSLNVRTYSANIPYLQVGSTYTLPEGTIQDMVVSNGLIVIVASTSTYFISTPDSSLPSFIVTDGPVFANESDPVTFDLEANVNGDLISDSFTISWKGLYYNSDSFTYNEGESFAISNIWVSGAVSNGELTIYMSDSDAGSIDVSSYGGLTPTFSYGSWFASGSITNINELLDGLEVSISNHYCENFDLNLIFYDYSQTWTKTFSATCSGPIDDAPVAKFSTHPDQKYIIGTKFDYTFGPDTFFDYQGSSLTYTSNKPYYMSVTNQNTFALLGTYSPMDHSPTDFVFDPSGTVAYVVSYNYGFYRLDISTNPMEILAEPYASIDLGTLGACTRVFYNSYNDHVFVICPDEIKVINVSLSDTSTIVSSYTATGIQATFTKRIEFVADLVYYLDSSNILNVVDFSNFESPTPVGQVSTLAQGFVLDPFMFILYTVNTSGIIAYDISSTTPVEIASDFRATYVDIQISGNKAYCKLGSSSVHVYNINNPSAPLIYLSAVSVSTSGFGIYLFGSTLYTVSTWGVSVYSFDRSRFSSYIAYKNLEPYISLGRIIVNNGVTFIAKYGKLYYYTAVATPAYSIAVSSYPNAYAPYTEFDINATNSLDLTTSTSLKFYIYGIRISSAYGWTEDVEYTFSSFWVGIGDLSTCSVTLTLSTSLAGEFSTGTSNGVTSTFNDGIWYASGAIDDVNALLGALKFIPAANFSSSFSFNVELDDGINPHYTKTVTMVVTHVSDPPFVANPISDQKYFIRDPFSLGIPPDTFSNIDGYKMSYSYSPQPTWLSNKPEGSFFEYSYGDDMALSVALSKKYPVAFIASGARMNIVNISDPANIVVISNFPSSTYSADLVEIEDEIVYLYHKGFGISLINVTVLSEPSLIGYYSEVNLGITDFVVNNKILYFVDNSTGMKIVSCIDPSSPALLSTISLSQNAFGITFSQSTIFVSDGGSGIFSYDVSDPENPSLFDFDLHLGTEEYRDCAVYENILYALTDTNLYFYDISTSHDRLIFLSSVAVTNPLKIHSFRTKLFILQDSYITVIEAANPTSPSTYFSNPLTPSVATEFTVSDDGIIYLPYSSNLVVMVGGATPYFYVPSSAQPTSYLAYTDITVEATEFGTLAMVSDTFRLNVIGIRCLDEYSFNEDSPLEFLDSSIIWVSGLSSNIEVNITLSDPSAGSFSQGTVGSTTSYFDSNIGCWTASGPVGEVNSLLAALIFTPSHNYYFSFYLNILFNDALFPLMNRTVLMTGIPDPTDFPIVVNPLPDKYFFMGKPFVFEFDEDTFYDPDHQALSYSSSGHPGWITLASRTFSSSDQDRQSTNFFITVTATDTTALSCSDNFTLFLFNFTQTNISSISFSDEYIYDVLNYPSPVHYIHFSLTNRSMLSDENFHLEILDLVFSDSTHFEASSTDLGNDEFSIAVSIRNPEAGSFSSELYIKCNSSYEEDLNNICATIPLSINIIGPVYTFSSLNFEMLGLYPYDAYTYPIETTPIYQEITMAPNSVRGIPLSPSYNISINSLILDNSDDFNATFTRDGDNILIRIKVIGGGTSSIGPGVSGAIGSLTVKCDTPPFTNYDCAVISLKSGFDPSKSFAELSQYDIDLTGFTQYDVLARPPLHDDLCLSLSLFPVHDSALGDLPLNPRYLLNTTRLLSETTYFQIKDYQILSHSNEFKVCLSSAEPSSFVAGLLELTCTDFLSSSCGIISLDTSVLGPVASLSSSSVNFGSVKSFDIFARLGTPFQIRQQLMYNVNHTLSIPSVPTFNFSISWFEIFPNNLETAFNVEFFYDTIQKDVAVNISLTGDQSVFGSIESAELRLHCSDPTYVSSGDPCAVIYLDVTIDPIFTLINSSNIVFPSHKLFDMLNYPSPVSYVLFSPNTYGLPAIQNYVLDIQDIVFDNSDHFNSSWISLDNNEFAIQIHMTNPIIGLLESKMFIKCNSPYAVMSDNVCETIDVSFSILGPLATLNVSTLNFGDITTYDILSHDNSPITQHMLLSPNHDFVIPEAPSFFLSPIFNFNSSYKDLFSLSVSLIDNHDLLISLSVLEIEPLGPFNVPISISTNTIPYTQVLCGTVNIIGDLYCPSFSIDTSQVSFHFNEYDVLARERVLFKTITLSPNHQYSILDDPSFYLNASTNFTGLDNDIFETELSFIDKNIEIDVYLISSEPGNKSSDLLIFCNDPCFSDSPCATIPISGEVDSPIYSVSTETVYFEDISDTDMVDGLFNPYEINFTVINILPIPTTLEFTFNVNCLFDSQDSENFFLSNTSTILSPDNLVYRTFVSTSIDFPRAYSTDLTCSVNEMYDIPYQQVTLPVKIYVSGSYPSASNNSILFHNASIYDNQLISEAPIQHRTLTLTNIGNVPLEIIRVSIFEELGPDEKSSFTFIEDCNFPGFLIPVDQSCYYYISFEPTRKGGFSGIFRIDSTAHFKPRVNIPLSGVLKIKHFVEKATLVDQLVQIAPIAAAVVLALLVLMGIIIAIGKCRRVPNQHPFILFILIITIYDFVTDVAFTISLVGSEEYKYFFYAAAGSLGISILINVVILIRFISQHLRTNIAFRKWFENNSASLSFTVVLSATNLGLMRILTSNLLGITGFSAPLTPVEIQKLNSLSIITHVTEDIPQLIIQAWIAILLGADKWSIILMLSLFGTLLALFFGIISRVLGVLYIKASQTPYSQTPDSSLPLPGDQMELPIAPNTVFGIRPSNAEAATASETIEFPAQEMIPVQNRPSHSNSLINPLRVGEMSPPRNSFSVLEVPVNFPPENPQHIDLPPENPQNIDLPLENGK